MNPSALAFQYFSPVPSPVLNRDEKSVFTSFSSRILKSFNFRVLTSEAFSIGLVDHWEREDCLTKKDHPYEMGDKFVGIMNRKISASTTNFYIFVHLLKSLGEPERALAREMEGIMYLHAHQLIEIDIVHLCSQLLLEFIERRIEYQLLLYKSECSLAGPDGFRLQETVWSQPQYLGE